jgi:ankyrin repeat protein
MYGEKEEGMEVETDKARVVVLCGRLVDATRAGYVEWQREEEEDTFVWQAEQATVSIGSRDKDGEPPYQLVVVNERGEKLEELASELVDNDQPAEWNEPLANLYRAAHRKALGADEIIEALIESLPKGRAVRSAGSSVPGRVEHNKRGAPAERR